MFCDMFCDNSHVTADLFVLRNGPKTSTKSCESHCPDTWGSRANLRLPSALGYSLVIVATYSAAKTAILISTDACDRCCDRLQAGDPVGDLIV
jgi:hypothetical protein